METANFTPVQADAWLAGCPAKTTSGGPVAYVFLRTCSSGPIPTTLSTYKTGKIYIIFGRTVL